VGIGQYGDREPFQEEHIMKKNVAVTAIAVVLVLAVAWAAFGQAGGGQRFAQMREAQMKALASLQEQVAKLKSFMEQAPSMRGRNFQDMSEEERTKMREEFTKRREEQQTIFAAIDQDLARLKGGREVAMEHQRVAAPLKEALASAQRENAKGTASILEKLIAERQKQFDDKMAAMGYTPDQIERMMQPRQRPQQ
jgi:hypothetical protein